MWSRQSVLTTVCSAQMSQPEQDGGTRCICFFQLVQLSAFQREPRPKFHLQSVWPCKGESPDAGGSSSAPSHVQSASPRRYNIFSSRRILSGDLI